MQGARCVSVLLQVICKCLGSTKPEQLLDETQKIKKLRDSHPEDLRIAICYYKSLVSLNFLDTVATVSMEQFEVKPILDEAREALKHLKEKHLYVK